MINSYETEIVRDYLMSIGKWDEFSTFAVERGMDIPLEEVTIVTGMWDLGRGNLDGWAHRPFDAYKENFFKLLKANISMCIWIPSSLEEEVWSIRKKHNTKVYIKEVEDFKTWFPFFEEHETIRTNPTWYNSVEWLSSSPQAALQMYNPMMMTKMFMVNDSALMNPFNTEYFYWIDGGLTSTVPSAKFTDGDVFRKIPLVYNDSIVHIAYPYEPATEIHGFEKNALYSACGLSSNDPRILISRGGFWGGPKDLIHEYNKVYYGIMEFTINAGYLGADECLFTIAAYKYPDMIERFQIADDGLVYPFFDMLDRVQDFIKTRAKKPITHRTSKSNLYVLSFNSPQQFNSVCTSLQLSDPELFTRSRKVLINNSTDITLFDDYTRLCTEYGFEEIRRENLGVCGGRQFAAEHFDDSDADFYMFFEDDMHLNAPDVRGETCSNGFRKYVPNLYNAVLRIMLKENLDFLKFSFTEFYGDNSTQWAWYNVSQEVRTKYWPDYDRLPEHGTDPNAPKTQFTHIKVVDETPYVVGEVYYSNWPQIVSRAGNKKMFLETLWARPYEQTWMSHMFQLTKENKLHTGVLLASPITHNRFDFYDGSLRKES